MLVFCVFLAGPVVASLVLSFTDFGLRDLRNPLGTDFVGLDNYLALLDDAKFWTALLNTAYFVVVGVPLTLVLGLAVGARARPRDQAVPDAVPRRLLPAGRDQHRGDRRRLAVPAQPRLGPRQHGCSARPGIQGPSWLANPTLAMPSIIAMAAWRNLGFAMIVFLAGLQTIPAQLYEAAAIDGAGRWQAFRHVTLPLLRPTILFIVVITTIGYLQLFEEPFVMTDGGPLDQTLSISMYMYQQGFKFFHQGYAAAIAWVLFLIVAVVAVRPVPRPAVGGVSAMTAMPPQRSRPRSAGCRGAAKPRAASAGSRRAQHRALRAAALRPRR